MHLKNGCMISFPTFERFRIHILFVDLLVASSSSSFSSVHLRFMASESGQKTQVIGGFQASGNNECYPEPSRLSQNSCDDRATALTSGSNNRYKSHHSCSFSRLYYNREECSLRCYVHRSQR